MNLGPGNGFPVYYDTLNPYFNEVIGNWNNDDSIYRYIEISDLQTRKFLTTSFHRPISKIIDAVYKRRIV